jgi:hypothetical protein
MRKIFKMATQLSKLFYEKGYLIFGWYFLFLQILIIIRLYIIDDFWFLVFYCYHTPIILSIGFFLRNIIIIRVMIITGLIGQSHQVIDFIYSIFYYPEDFALRFLIPYDYNYYVFFISFLSHFLMIIPLLFILYKNKIPKISMIFSFIYIGFVYIMAKLFVPVFYNTNFVHTNELSFLPNTFYSELYLFYAIILVIIPTFVIQYYFNKLPGNEIVKIDK